MRPSSALKDLGSDLKNLVGLQLLRRDIQQEHAQGLIADEQLVEELAVVEAGIQRIREVHWSRDVIIEIGRGLARLGPGLVFLLLVILGVNLYRWLG
mgnify:FL=1